MTAIEKIKKYLLEHKTPVDSVFLAKRFLISTTTATHALKKLEDQGFAQRTKFDGRFVWTKRPTKDVAVPKDVRPVYTPIQPTRIRTSYPHVRGYDD